MIRNVETSTDRFRRDFDRWLDRSNLDGTTREDRYNSHVKKFEKATDRLRSEFDRNDRRWETREQVQETLNAAKPVAQMMNNHRFGRNLENQWRNLRKALNMLASTYSCFDRWRDFGLARSVKESQRFSKTQDSE